MGELLALVPLKSVTGKQTARHIERKKEGMPEGALESFIQKTGHRLQQHLKKIFTVKCRKGKGCLFIDGAGTL